MSDHALLGPSGAKRWMACTPSARFELEFEEKESEYAEQGTAAHELADRLIRLDLGGNDGADVAELESFIKENKYYDAEMEEAVQFYVDYVMKAYAQAKQNDYSAILMPEQRLDYSEFVQDGFGTGDATIISDKTIEIIDLKYGTGVKVEVEDNPQLRLYGLAAWNTFKILFDIEEVVMTIVQPRLDHIATERIKVKDLLEWTEKEVVPKGKLAWEGKGEFVAGSHCQFCKAQARCKALRDYSMEMAKHEFDLPHKLSDQDIADVLEKLDQLMNWGKAVKEHALYQAENKGVKFPGWKLVEGRSNRKITDEEKAKDILICEGVAEPLIYKPREMLGITALEKLVGKKKFVTLLDDIIEKPPGKPTLVKDNDKRPELNTSESAKADFQ